MSFAPLLTQTVSYKVPSTRDSSGDWSYGSLLTTLARVERRQGTVRSEGGEISEFEIVLVTSIDLPDDALIWLPGDDTSSLNAAYHPIKRVQASDPSGTLTLFETYL